MSSDFLTLHITVDEQTHRPYRCAVKQGAQEVGELPLSCVEFKAGADRAGGHWLFGLHGIHVDLEQVPGA